MGSLLRVVSRVIGKDPERDFSTCDIVMAATAADVSKRLSARLTEVNSWVRRPATEVDYILDDAENDDRFDAL